MYAIVRALPAQTISKAHGRGLQKAEKAKHDIFARHADPAARLCALQEEYEKRARPLQMVTRNFSPARYRECRAGVNMDEDSMALQIEGAFESAALLGSLHQSIGECAASLPGTQAIMAGQSRCHQSLGDEFCVAVYVYATDNAPAAPASIPARIYGSVRGIFDYLRPQHRVV